MDPITPENSPSALGSSSLSISPPPSPPNAKVFDSFKKLAFIIGSTLIIFAAAKNTITWYAQKFWGASGSFWQNQYDTWYDRFGGDDRTVTALGTFFITTIFFWGLNVLLIILDLTGQPQFLLKYKMQPEKNVPLPTIDLFRAAGVVVMNQVFVSLPMLYILYYLMLWRGCPFQGNLPTFQWVLLEIAVFTLVEELCFYYSHRVLHHPSIYKYVHKKHHEWTAPIGITSIYAHPLEHLVSNILPPAFGPLLMGSHLGTTWLWFCIALFSTVNAHCGYHFPFFPSPEAHDFHHLKFTNNYGVLGVLDRFHGTDNLFRKSKAYDRHIMMLTLIPPQVQFPSNKIITPDCVTPAASEEMELLNEYESVNYN